MWDYRQGVYGCVMMTVLFATCVDGDGGVRASILSPVDGGNYRADISAMIVVDVAVAPGHQCTKFSKVGAQAYSLYNYMRPPHCLLLRIFGRCRLPGRCLLEISVKASQKRFLYIGNILRH
jgi:hypothetical protein